MNKRFKLVTKWTQKAMLCCIVYLLATVSLANAQNKVTTATKANPTGYKQATAHNNEVLSTTAIPAVIANLPLNEWQAISLNTIKDLDPCPARPCAWSAVSGVGAVINDWNGGAYASKEGALGGLVYFGGGHNGYYGNEVYFFDLASLTWERRNDPTDGQIPGDVETFGLDSQARFWDGNPLPTHTYESVFYDPLQNLFWVTKIRDPPSPLPASPNGWISSTLPAAFSLDTNTWSDGGTAPVRSQFSATAWDAKRNIAWVVDHGSGGELHSFDPVLDVWQTHVSGFVLNIDFTAAIDPTRDLLVFTNFNSRAKKVAVIDLDLPNAGWFLVDTVGAISIENKAKVGFEWVPQLGGFITWKAGHELFLLTPPANDIRNNPWVWSKIIATGVTPDRPHNGPYSKFQYVPELGIALVASSVTGSVFAIRLAETGPADLIYANGFE